MKSKRFAAVLGAVLAVSCLPFHAEAAENYNIEQGCIDVTYSTSYEGFGAALTENNELYVWGEGTYNYKSGDYTAAGRLYPVEVPLTYEAVAIDGHFVLSSTGDLYWYDFENHDPLGSCVLTNIRTLGEGTAITNDGELYLLDAVYDGNGNLLDYENGGIKKVETLNNVVSAYNYGSCVAAVTEDGSLYTWGSNQYAQSYGNGHLGYISDHSEYEAYNQQELYPRKVDIDHVIDAKFNGTYGDLFILTVDHTLYQCTYTSESVWFERLFDNIQYFTGGSSFHGGGTLFAVADDGTLYAYGSSIWGYGDGELIDADVFQVKKEVTQFGKVTKAVTSGENFAVINKGGVLFTWGANDKALVGNTLKASEDSEGLGEPNTEDTFYADWIFYGHIFDNGDVDGSGVIDASDAAAILVAATELGANGISGLYNSQAYAADVNYDGVIDAADAAIVLLYAAEVGAGNTDITLDDLIG